MWWLKAWAPLECTRSLLFLSVFRSQKLSVASFISLFTPSWLPGKRKSSIPQFGSVQLLSCVRLFATRWIAAHQASLSITKSQTLLKFMTTKSMMPSNHLILYPPLLLLSSIFPSIRVFSNESYFASGGQSTVASASASVLPMNIQDWFL